MTSTTVEDAKHSQEGRPLKRLKTTDTHRTAVQKNGRLICVRIVMRGDALQQLVEKFLGKIFEYGSTVRHQKSSKLPFVHWTPCSDQLWICASAFVSTGSMGSRTEILRTVFSESVTLNFRECSKQRHAGRVFTPFSKALLKAAINGGKLGNLPSFGDVVRTLLLLGWVWLIDARYERWTFSWQHKVTLSNHKSLKFCRGNFAITQTGQRPEQEETKKTKQHEFLER